MNAQDFKPQFLMGDLFKHRADHVFGFAILLLFMFVGMFHVGLILTEYMQEDALITMRTSFNLADHGEYTFNLGEGYPGATSLLYGHYVAGVRVIFGDFAILAVSMINVGFAMVAAHMLALSVLPRQMANDETRAPYIYMLVFMVAGLAPAMMRAAASGMETPILIFCMAAALFFVARRQSIPLACVLAILPFVRIDAVAFALIVVAVMALFRLRDAVIALLGIVVGIAALLAANVAVFDAIVPLTAQAKEIAYQPERDFSSVLGRALETFFTFSFLPGITSKFIGPFVYSILGVAFFAAALMAAVKYIPIGIDAIARYRHQAATKIINYDAVARQSIDAPILIMALATLMVPAAYVYGGVLFFWYLWPFSIFATLVLLDAILKRFALGFKSFAVIAVMLTLAGAFNIATHINIGAQESGFRASIGTDIKNRAAAADTLFLEPAGYIPYFAEIETWDTIGLASPRVLPYRQDITNENWWFDFIQGEKPTFILERKPIHDGGAADGGYILNTSEQDWFNQAYALQNHYQYDEYLSINRGLFTPLLKLGSHSDYYLYRLRP